MGHQSVLSLRRGRAAPSPASHVPGSPSSQAVPGPRAPELSGHSQPPLATGTQELVRTALGPPSQSHGHAATRSGEGLHPVHMPSRAGPSHPLQEPGPDPRLRAAGPKPFSPGLQTDGPSDKAMRAGGLLPRGCHSGLPCPPTQKSRWRNSTAVPTSGQYDGGSWGGHHSHREVRGWLLAAMTALWPCPLTGAPTQVGTHRPLPGEHGDQRCAEKAAQLVG